MGEAGTGDDDEPPSLSSDGADFDFINDWSRGARRARRARWSICKLPPHILVVLVVLSGIDDFVVLNFGSISSIE